MVGWGAHRLGLASILGHDPHEIGFTCTFYCRLYMVLKGPSFLFQGQVMEHCYPQLARSTGLHHHSYWTVLLIMVAVLEIGYRFYYQSFVRLFPIKNQIFPNNTSIICTQCSSLVSIILTPSQRAENSNVDCLSSQAPILFQ